jgi:hypothetical protein
MASEFLISPLTLDEQAAVLSEFLTAKRRPLPLEQATKVATALNLATGGGKTELARKLAAELARYGVKLNHTVGVEAAAQMCGGENWMRLRQTLVTPVVGTQTAPAYLLQLALTGQGDGRIVPHDSLAATADAILKLLREAWPNETAPAFCNIEVRPQVLSLEFEHPTAPWLTLRIFKAADGQDDLVSLAFEDAEVRTFCARMQRSLEFTHPGLLVMGGERSAVLPATYMLLPHLQQPASGFDYICQASMELYMWFGSLDLAYPKEPHTPGILAAVSGPVSFKPRWVNGLDGKETYEDTDTAVAVDLAKRLSRLQHLTKCTMTEFISTVCTGPGASAAAAHRFNQDRLVERMQAASLSPAKLAELAGCTPNDLLRAQKYGYASTELVRKLSDALGFSSPNQLLPEPEESEIGVRVDAGAAFLKALKDAHQFKLVMGNSLAGEELEIAQGIADSLKEYVDIFQFASDPLGSRTNIPGEPADEVTIAGHIQTLIDELHEMNLVVLVAKGVRYVNTPGQAKDQPPLAMLTGTICVERQSELQKPEAFRTRSA